MDERSLGFCDSTHGAGLGRHHPRTATPRRSRPRSGSARQRPFACRYPCSTLWRPSTWNAKPSAVSSQGEPLPFSTWKRRIHGRRRARRPNGVAHSFGCLSGTRSPWEPADFVSSCDASRVAERLRGEGGRPATGTSKWADLRQKRRGDLA